jgi:hypothetical protein
MNDKTKKIEVNSNPDPAVLPTVPVSIPTPSKLAIIDIANATNLFIAPGSTSGSRAVVGNESKKLFKITDNGYIQEVSYFDEDGNETTINNAPTAIQTDSIENIYYIVRLGNSAEIMKINTSNPNNLTKIAWIESRGQIQGFDVSPAGHTIYFIPSENLNRIKKVNGGLINLPQNIDS